MVLPSAAFTPPTIILLLTYDVDVFDAIAIPLYVLLMIFARMVMFVNVPGKLNGVTIVVYAVELLNN